MSTAPENLTADTQAPEQLELLADITLPLQFRLDRQTRERGMAHVAAIKAQLAARAAARTQHPGATRAA